MNARKIVMASAIVLGLAMVAQAGIVPIVNGDFEDTTVSYPSGAPVGWGNGGNNAIGILNIGGRNVCLFNGNTSSQVLNQVVDHQIVSGATYDYSVEINNGVSVGTWDWISVQLWAVPSAGGAQWLTGGTVNRGDFSSPIEWKTFGYQYVDDGTHAGSKLLVQFQVHGGTQAYIDNVQIVETVPEPATMALLGVGGILGLRRRLCRK